MVASGFFHFRTFYEKAPEGFLDFDAYIKCRFSEQQDPGIKKYR